MSEVQKAMDIHSKHKESKKVRKYAIIKGVKNISLLAAIGVFSYVTAMWAFHLGQQSAYEKPIFKNSDTEFISVSDAKKLSEHDLILAMAEIYARHGQDFDDMSIYNHCSDAIPDYYKKIIEDRCDSISLYDLNYIEQMNIRVLESVYPGYQDPTLESFDLDDPYISSTLDEMYSLY